MITQAKIDAAARAIADEFGIRKNVLHDQLAKAALEAAERAAWRPISEAPKDGTKVIVAYRNRLGNWREVMAEYLTEEDLASTSDDFDREEAGWPEPGWYEASETHEFDLPCDETPTHFRPLSAPPEVEP